MASVTHFKQYLEKLEKTKSHCAVYNYLHCFCDDDKELSIELFESFYRKALLFSHWQKQFNLLHNALKQILLSFSKFHGGIGFDIAGLDDFSKWPLITVQNEKTLLEVINVYLKNNASKGDQVKVLPLKKNRVLGLVLRCNGLEVYSFSPIVILNQGRAEPLCTLSKLYYSDQYELKPFYRQMVEDKHLNFISFKFKEDKVTGYSCQGDHFQPSMEFKQKTLSNLEILFYPLKALENFFIDNKSDPHYKKLINSLHQYYRQILISPHEISSLDVQNILSHAKRHLKDIYPKDRLLFLLIANIEFHYRSKTQTLSHP